MILFLLPFIFCRCCLITLCINIFIGWVLVFVLPGWIFEVTHPLLPGGVPVDVLAAVFLVIEGEVLELIAECLRIMDIELCFGVVAHFCIDREGFWQRLWFALG